MDEQDIALHQFFGYIVNHVPEYRDDYRDHLSTHDSGPAQMLDGFSRFVVGAWHERATRPAGSHSGDTFSRLTEAIEMGLRSQEDEVAALIMEHLGVHMNSETDMVQQLGECTKELLAKKDAGKG